MQCPTLERLPVELLYEIQLYALSESLPLVSRHFRDVFKGTTSKFRLQYLVGYMSRYPPSSSLDRALRFPICSKEVLDVSTQYYEHWTRGWSSTALPTRLFRSLSPRTIVDNKTPGLRWTDHDHPLPFLKYLWNIPGIPPLNPNSFEGYALARAVHANFIPLVQFLLAHGADPACKNALSVRIAIRQKDLGLVRMLIEQELKGTRKRQKLGDRVKASTELLREAVKCDAREIVDYFIKEKGLVPDMQTLRMMGL